MMKDLNVRNCSVFTPFPGPGGWGSNWASQNGQDYAYFDSGFSPDQQHTALQQDGVFHLTRTKRHRKITRPARDQKIQIFFNITGRRDSICLHLVCMIAEA